MQFLALAVDYDGTLAGHGRVTSKSVEALKRVSATGRKLLLVTGRDLGDLLQVFPELALFDRVVAENGALLYNPQTQESRLLSAVPPEVFVRELQRRGVEPLSVGGSIVATVHPHETVVLETIRELGLELHVIFNKGAVMVLPTGINKATGLKCALEELGLSAHNVVAAGDAENDHALLGAVELGVAVANAVPMLKENADHVTAAANGAGVAELIEDLVSNDLQERATGLRRHRISLGTRIQKDPEENSGAAVTVPAYGPIVLAVGSSGSGKSTFVSAVVEQLIEQEYQCCIIDPEGDYENFPNVIALGDPNRAPSAAEVLTALEKAHTSIAVNLLGVKLEDRPQYFLDLFSHLQELRARTGRPHWIVVDETHHVLPADRPAPPLVKSKSYSTIYVTVEPKTVNPEVLHHADIVAVLGEEPVQALRDFGSAIDAPLPRLRKVKLQSGQALLWLLDSDEPPFVVHSPPSTSERRRHVRKYAQGELNEDSSFYFRGPHNKLNLRAHNLHLFVRMAEGVDDETWLHHLQRGDYSQWMREHIKDPVLAEEVQAIEACADLSAQDSRERIKEAIDHHYTLPAAAGS